MDKKKSCICISVLIFILIIAVAITVTLVLVLRKHKKDENEVLNDVISNNSTFPNGSYTISVKSLKSGLPGQAPLFVNISMLNYLGMKVDNSSLIAETNRLSYFFVRLPPTNDVSDNSINAVVNARVKRQLISNNGSIGIRFGNSDTLHVIPLNLSMTVNSGLSLIGRLTDNSQIYQLEVRMADAMCSSSNVGSCSIVNWTPYSISSENTGSQASFNNELPVACGSQCNADANSACATSCSACDGEQVAGADTPVTRRYKMGTMKATNLTFSFETYTVKDRIIVSYEGQNLFDSGCVGTEGEKYAPISFEGNSVEVRVDVEPNCEGTTGTEWYFTLPCANCQNCEEYQCLDDSKAHCGSDGYLIEFGLFFCNRYMEFYEDFTVTGQAFIDCVRPRLLDYLEDYLEKVNEVDCDDLYNKAFDSHVQIYLDCNFCNVFFSNPKLFFKVIYQTVVGNKFSLAAWKQIGLMTLKCPGVYHQDLCNAFPDLWCVCTSCTL